MTLDRARQLMERSDLLATHTMGAGHINRPYATPALWAARDQIAQWMQLAGMTTHTDAVGNLFGRWAPANQEQALLFGGHFDTVIDAGKYDGTLGILTGIATVQHLRKTGVSLPFAIEVVAIADEEGNRFRAMLMGSAAATGLFRDEWFDLEDTTGITLREVFAELGIDRSTIAADVIDPARYLGFIEAHIEQGPVLEQENLPVGVVSAIIGSQRASITLGGTAGHAGTVPMAMRRDALAAAAELVLAVEETGRTTTGLVATVGRMDVAPGAPNVIPGQVTLSLDVRHEDLAVLTAAVEVIRAQAEEISDSRNIDLGWAASEASGSTFCDSGLSSALTGAIAAAGIPPRSLVSGAGHDAMTFARIMPATMLFVRCRGGISHNPAETVTVEDVAVALKVLERFVESVATADR